MKSITFGLGLFVFSSMLSTSGTAPLMASSTPVYNQQLSRVRFMTEEPIIKVLLSKDQDGFAVEVKGPHNIYDPYTGKKLDAAFTGSAYSMIPTQDGIKWGQEFLGIFQITIIPDEPSSGVCVNGIAYPGVTTFYEVDNRLTAVNWASLDDFTASIVSNNFLPRETDQKEALAAYAIAIRTKAYQQLLSSNSIYWDVTADGCGYRGNAIVRFDTPFHDAMKVTKRIVMTGSEQSNLGTTFDKKAIDDVREKMPVSEVHSMAKNGKDAKIILHRFFPDQNLMMVEQKPVEHLEVVKSAE